MKYKCGDRVVVEIKDTGINMYGNGLYYVTRREIPGAYPIQEKLILGKLEDFQPAKKKIKMTVDEKKEFDKAIKDNRQDIGFFFMSVMEYPDLYPNLHKRLFSESTTKDKQAQIEFVKALENPSLIEVEKEKKYYVHLFKSQSNGYLNQCRDSSGFLISYIDETCRCKTQFTQSEIDKLQTQEQFKAIDLNKCKEEVEDE